jgi:hypothetical protein
VVDISDLMQATDRRWRRDAEAVNFPDEFPIAWSEALRAVLQSREEAAKTPATAGPVRGASSDRVTYQYD